MNAMAHSISVAPIHLLRLKHGRDLPKEVMFGCVQNVHPVVGVTRMTLHSGAILNRYRSHFRFLRESRWISVRCVSKHTKRGNIVQIVLTRGTTSTFSTCSGKFDGNRHTAQKKGEESERRNSRIQPWHQIFVPLQLQPRSPLMNNYLLVRQSIQLGTIPRRLNGDTPRWIC